MDDPQDEYCSIKFEDTFIPVPDTEWDALVTSCTVDFDYVWAVINSSDENLKQSLLSLLTLCDEQKDHIDVTGFTQSIGPDMFGEVMPEDFKSATELKAYVREALSRLGPTFRVSQRSTNFYNFLVELLKYGPYQKAMNDMRDITIDRGVHGNLVLSILKTYRPFLISWLKCVQAIPKFHKRPRQSRIPQNVKHLNKAMRSSIIDQIMDLKKREEYTCELCKVQGTDPAVFHCDHIYEFRKLVVDFLKDRRDVPVSFEFIQCIPHFTKSDIQFEMEWTEYHRTHATLRILCKSCNLRRPRKEKSELSHQILEQHS